MLEILKKAVQAQLKDATDEQITAIATAIEKSGKLIPEQKYLDLKKDNESKAKEVTKLTEQVESFGELNPEDAKKAQEDLKALQQKIADEKTQSENDAKDAAKIAHSNKVTEAIKAKLTESGAVDASLVAAAAIAKAGGAENVELNEDGTLKTDVTFAVEHVKTEHPTNFTKAKVAGGGSGAGAGGGETDTWTTETVASWNEGKSDQEKIDQAKSDNDYAKAAGLTSFITEE